jgi:probable Rubsico expression protein CbbX
MITETEETDVADESAARVSETLAALDAELIGLAPVKRHVRELAALLQVDRGRRQIGLTTTAPTPNMSFIGGPGTGKTAVAVRMATILHALGYIGTPQVHAVSRDDLVATTTTEAPARGAGGVLFIDVAHFLPRPEHGRDDGQQAIEILLTEMANKRGDLVVIFAGDPDRMAGFFSANPGFGPLVPHRIAFADYNHGELMQIADLMVESEGFRFADGARDAFSEYLTRRMARPRFANARSVRNAIERCRRRQARRLVSLDRPLGRDDLIRLTAEDIYGSSLFDDPTD